MAKNYTYSSGSQENLDELDKADIAVHTKAPELIGHLCCVLWIYVMSPGFEEEPNGDTEHSMSLARR